MRRLGAISILATMLLATGVSAVRAHEAPAVYTIVATTSLDGTLLTDPCPGEDVLLSGSFVGIYHGTPPLGEAPYHQAFVLAYQGVSGIGQTSGTNYVLAGATLQAYQWTSAEEFTLNANLHLVGQGGAADFSTTFLVHFTRDASGELTADIYDLSTTCY